MCGDVRVVQRGQRLRLRGWNRASRSASLANEIGQDLDRDLAIELGVAGAIDLAHPAGAERGENLVGAEARAGREGHHYLWIAAVQLRTTVSGVPLAGWGRALTRNRFPSFVTA